MKYKNPMASHKDAASKLRAFRAAAAEGYLAWDMQGREYLLRDLRPEDVEYIGGAWRVQNKFTEPIQVVRGHEFVLMDLIPRVEKNMFEFYRARMVGQNCYGRFVLPGVHCVVAKYETDTETHWAYGDTIERARAFLGIRLYDRYMDEIHSIACKNKQKSNEK